MSPVLSRAIKALLWSKHYRFVMLAVVAMLFITLLLRFGSPIQFSGERPSCHSTVVVLELNLMQCSEQRRHAA
jgi:hypothetical protein